MLIPTLATRFVKHRRIVMSNGESLGVETGSSRVELSESYRA